ncbi:hypothetical protein IW140_006220 [Coemansia sp. RSA 1813]|nr:hypothetical protein EV178_006201 [Coemansia sp. RSA 1646]KAJ1766626.1 hypothetical protein LPJ74_005787 [Coemansia sp. RSA 1843]KAJ2085665.1 hypothetical protein IW138_006189 [Coemansia sp. RSA 986]KAJ2210585.1 hypothetical protein EV179_006132 [Coemansia sp. RSA 487]KAJ2563124.1 hypothetical protein IW140_006220 [Coemansia sp. RSA 1813]
MSDKDTLLEFGFSQLRVEKALKATNNGGLQPALDWLDKHANDPDIDSPIEESADTGDAANSAAEQPAADAEAQSLVCNECGKQFKNEDLAQYHAVKSGHTDFAQSTEAVKPLSEEEKAQKLQELQERIKQKRQQREAAEKEEQRKNEMIRRKAGQDQSEQQEKMKEEQILRDIEKRKREKEDDKIAARKIKEQIEQDKRDRAARFAREKAERDGTAVPQEPKPAVVKTAQLQNASSNSSQARLQIRPMLTGDDAPTQPVTHVFDADQTLKDVFDFVKKEIPNIGHHFKLSTTFPPKEFSDHHESKTLKELGLVPSAALILTK